MLSAASGNAGLCPGARGDAVRARWEGSEAARAFLGLVQEPLRSLCARSNLRWAQLVLRSTGPRSDVRLSD